MVYLNQCGLMKLDGYNPWPWTVRDCMCYFNHATVTLYVCNDTLQLSSITKITQNEYCKIAYLDLSCFPRHPDKFDSNGNGHMMWKAKQLSAKRPRVWLFIVAEEVPSVKFEYTENRWCIHLAVEGITSINYGRYFRLFWPITVLELSLPSIT